MSRSAQAATLCAVMLMSCQEQAPSGSVAPPPTAPTPAEPALTPTPDRPPRATTRPTLQPAPPRGPVAEAVRAIARRAQDKGEVVVIYVGAKWCEPCRHFKNALRSGELARRGITGVRFIEFDHDRDKARLAQAGYASRLLPLFAVPGPDGRGTSQRLMGARKGTGALDHIVPGLKALMGTPPATP